ncbi:SPOR domain-containing protein [Marinomonas sp. A79]|uniref:SPOR domain-containing protein n=1 Tax=Marinomonas vulgaris TaxID=2823372 RepID=A0ABS5HF45_9GAMM|nr:SPOR domain-containing protein [Marinomonas vulgaris]MBR7890246.1 SPOR domain-containing protein [Marinomonas vulgaris]
MPLQGVPWYGQGDVWFKYSMKGSAKAIDIILDKCGIGASQEKSNLVSQRLPKNGDWTLLIATFKSLENASKLIEKLNAYGHPAYLKTKDNLFIVNVGAGILRKDAELFKEKIKDEFSLNGIVAMYSEN